MRAKSGAGTRALGGTRGRGVRGGLLLAACAAALAFALTGAGATTALAMSTNAGDEAASAQRAQGHYQVEYRGQAEGLVSVADDFFAHFPALMPGGSAQGTVTILNTTDTEQEIFFRTLGGGAVDTQGKPCDLGSVVQLRVSDSASGKMLYEGAIADAQSQDVSLGTFAQGAGTTLTFSVALPASADNAYANAEGDVTWRFTTRDALGEGGGSDGSGNGSGDGNGTSDDSGIAGGNNGASGGAGKNPLGTDGSWLSQTGDKLMSIVPVLAIVAAIAVVAIVVALVIRRKSKHDEDRR